MKFKCPYCKETHNVCEDVARHVASGSAMAVLLAVARTAGAAANKKKDSP